MILQQTIDRILAVPNIGVQIVGMCSGTIANLLFSDDFDRANGGLGDDWVASTWLIDTNEVQNNPNKGADVLANGDMEVDVGWPSYYTPVSNSLSAAQKHGGSFSRELVADGNFDGFYQQAGVAGTFYHVTFWTYRSAGPTNAIPYFVIQGAPNSTAAWVKEEIVERPDTLNAGRVYVRANNAGTFYGDDISKEPLTLSELIATTADEYTGDVMVSCLMTNVQQRTPAGLALGVDDRSNPTNLVLVRFNGLTGFNLDKYVGSTPTTIDTATVTAGAYTTNRICLRRVGTTIQFWYGGVLKSEQVIADAGLSGIQGMFCAHDANTIDDFAIHLSSSLKSLIFIGDSMTAHTPGTDVDKWSAMVAMSPTFGMTKYANVAGGAATIMAHMDAQTVDAGAVGGTVDAINILLGTNDADDAGITAEYQENLVELDGYYSGVKIFCLPILPRTLPPDNSAVNNPRIATAVSNAQALGVNCESVDISGWGFDPAVHTDDGLHPNAAGKAIIYDGMMAVYAAAGLT